MSLDLFLHCVRKSERGWTRIQNAGLGYVLIQLRPVLLTVLKEIGSAI